MPLLMCAGSASHWWPSVMWWTLGITQDQPDLPFHGLQSCGLSSLPIPWRSTAVKKKQKYSLQDPILFCSTAVKELCRQCNLWETSVWPWVCQVDTTCLMDVCENGVMQHITARVSVEGHSSFIFMKYWSTPHVVLKILYTHLPSASGFV